MPLTEWRATTTRREASARKSKLSDDYFVGSYNLTSHGDGIDLNEQFIAMFFPIQVLRQKPLQDAH